MKKAKDGIYARYVKRGLDIFCALAALLVFCWLYAILALLVRIKLGKPVIFKQNRPGKDERIFTLCKFRTMTDARDENGDLLPDAQRLTKFGRILRATSLDELPEAWNILKGDMSVIGPRPWNYTDLKYYNDEERKRFELRPGLSGWAQVNGRNDASWPERIRCDIEYVQNVSFRFDLRIVFLSALKMIKHDNIGVRGEGDHRDFAVYRMIEEAERMNKDILPSQEIGSFFCFESGEYRTETMTPAGWLPQGDDSVYTFSGRDAILWALRDISAHKTVKRAYIPSYCCTSMISPFLEQGIECCFYDVDYRNGLRFDIQYDKKCDLFFAMNYFGVRREEMDRAIEHFASRGVTVLEDITHTLLHTKPVSAHSDYAVASLRKWFSIPTGGFLLKREGKLDQKPCESGDDAVAGRIESMRLKQDYLDGKDVDKTRFLELSQRFEASLNYVHDAVLDTRSAGILEKLDVAALAEKRRRNADVLYDCLEEDDTITPLFSREEAESGCPLFVPILLPNEDRNSLRDHLIENGVFCPIHWPEVLGTKPGIKPYELSLICDQRYDTQDMLRMVELIKQWKKTHRSSDAPVTV